MPTYKNVARAVSVGVLTTAGAAYVVTPWPNDSTAKMYYSKDGATPVAVTPARVDATLGGYVLSTSILTSTIWNCDELRIFWVGSGIAYGEVVFYPEADFTSTVAGRVDAAVSSRMATFALPTNFSAFSITAGGAVTVGTNNDKTGYSLSQAFPTNFSSMVLDVNGRMQVQYGTAAGQVNLSGGNLAAAPPDSSGVTTLLSRLTSLRATGLDFLDQSIQTVYSIAASADTKLAATRMTILDRLATMVEPVTGGFWRFLAVSLSAAPGGSGSSGTVAANPQFTGKVGQASVAAAGANYFQFWIFATAGGDAVTAGGYTVTIAFTPGANDTVSTWTATELLTGRQSLRRVLIGTGGLALSAGTYYVRIKATDGTTTQYLTIGTVKVY